LCPTRSVPSICKGTKLSPAQLPSFGPYDILKIITLVVFSNIQIDIIIVDLGLLRLCLRYFNPATSITTWMFSCAFN